MGACANAPMVAIHDAYYEDLDALSLGELLDRFVAGETPEPGSAIGRHGSAPLGEQTTLIDPSLYDGSRAAPIERLPNLPEPAGAA
jgi:NADH-quinone oxidoreductase subunit E